MESEKFSSYAMHKEDRNWHKQNCKSCVAFISLPFANRAYYVESLWMMQAKRSSLLSTERSNQTEPAFMKDEEESNQIFETSTVTVTSAENATKEEVGDRLERPRI